MNRFLTLLALGCGLTLSGGQAFAQDGSGIRQVLGTIGLIAPEQPEIDYRARPPLVVPPQAKLPDPQAARASRNANWPNDPDVAARRAKAADARKPATERDTYKLLGDRPHLLSAEDQRKGRVFQTPPTKPYDTMDDTVFARQIQPILLGKELAAREAANNEAANLSREEPPRRYLSDPPIGLRKPAAGAEVGKVGQREAPSTGTGNVARDYYIEESKN